MTILQTYVRKKVLSEFFNDKNKGRIKIACRSLDDAVAVEQLLLDNKCYWKDHGIQQKNEGLAKYKNQSLFIFVELIGRSAEISFDIDPIYFSQWKGKLILL